MFGNPANSVDYVWARKRANEIRRAAFAKATYAGYSKVVHGQGYAHGMDGRDIKGAWLSERQYGCPSFYNRYLLSGHLR